MLNRGIRIDTSEEQITSAMEEDGEEECGENEITESDFSNDVDDATYNPNGCSYTEARTHSIYAVN